MAKSLRRTRSAARARSVTRAAAIVLLLGGCGSAPRMPVRLEIIAHRGAHPYYYGEGGIDRHTGCSAGLMRSAEPAYIENTIPAVAAAFELGATMVEIDIRRTADDQLVVFHDAMLECRTDGSGAPGERTLEYLKRLDAGYGYTGDGGRTYPFRGTGVGMIPTLEEMLDAFPEGSFLIDDKDGSAESTRLLTETLARYPEARRRKLMYWGRDSRWAALHARFPELTKLSTRAEMENCAAAARRRLMVGALPEACRHRALILPGEPLQRWYVRWALGWPDRFLEKVHKAKSVLYIDTDSEEMAVELGQLPIHGILTDRIELLGPLLSKWRLDAAKAK